MIEICRLCCSQPKRYKGSLKSETNTLSTPHSQMRFSKDGLVIVILGQQDVCRLLDVDTAFVSLRLYMSFWEAATSA